MLYAALAITKLVDNLYTIFATKPTVLLAPREPVDQIIFVNVKHQLLQTSPNNAVLLCCHVLHAGLRHWRHTARPAKLSGHTALAP
jgi:hypothetical protein